MFYHLKVMISVTLEGVLANLSGKIHHFLVVTSVLTDISGYFPHFWFLSGSCDCGLDTKEGSTFN
jgi:hypothetical protein